MWRAFFSLLAGLCLIGGMKPVAVAAALPKLGVDFIGKNLTQGTDWSSPVTANNQDVVRYRLIITNSEPGTIATKTGVQIVLPGLGLKLTMHPFSNVLSTNATAREARALTNYSGEGNYGLVYIPGTAKLTRAGAVTDIVPDSAGSNLTTERVQIGDVSAGEANRAVVEFDVRVVVEAPEAVTATPTPEPEEEKSTGGGAVAGKAPETGLADGVAAETAKWMAAGAGGIWLKREAEKIRRLAELIRAGRT